MADPTERLRQAEEALEARRPQVALDSLEGLNGGLSVWLLRGTALAMSGRTAEARGQFEEALKADPINADALYNLGLCHFSQNDLASARQCFDAALASRKDHEWALVSLGVVLVKLRCFAEAEELFQNFLERQPGHLQARFNLANLQFEQGRLERASAEAERLHWQAPEDAAFAHLLSRVRHAQYRIEEAIALSRRALALRPDDQQTEMGLAESLILAGQLDEAIAILRSLLAQRSREPELHHKLGFALWLAGRWKDARAAFERTIALQSDHGDARYMCAVLSLSAGAYEAGVREHAWRWRKPAKPTHRSHPYRRWKGEEILTGDLLVWREQGVGDEIAFAAWIPHLVARGYRVVLESEPRLCSLFARSFEGVTVIPALTPPAEEASRGGVVAQCPIGDVFGLLRPWEAGALPPPTYLTADPLRRKAFRETLDDLHSGTKIGISWHSKSPGVGLRKSAPLVHWGPILSNPGPLFVNLQYGDSAQELAEVGAQWGAAIYTDPTLDRFDDLDGLAALIDCLDLVITVSNVTAHLAGALGKACLLLLGPGQLWYWGRSGKSVPFYRSVRAFRATAGEGWENQITSIGACLSAASSRNEG